jgi:hypothetical protein
MPTKRTSTRFLDALPDINGLIRLSKALAMLDAALSPTWDYRYYSFNSNWGPDEMMASMRNGSGDEYFVLFNDHGAAMKGFDHESIMSPWSSGAKQIWPGMYDRVPAEFSSFLNEPAFSMADVTFCIWRKYSDAAWHSGVQEFPPGDDPDGSAWMLEIFRGDPEQYQRYARDYYSVDLPLNAIEHVYRLQPLTDEVLRALNSGITSESLHADVLEIGYPTDAA